MFQSSAAKIVAVAEVVVLVLMTIAISWKVSIVGAIVVAILSLPVAVLTVYDVDCTFVGSCDVYGWIKTIMILLYHLVVIVLLILLMSAASATTAASTSATTTTTASAATAASTSAATDATDPKKKDAATK